MMGDYPTALDGRSDHKAQTLRVFRDLNSAVYSDRYNTLQDAVDAAIGAPDKPDGPVRTACRALLISGHHALTEPLRIRNTQWLHIRAYGARITAAADMDRLLDIDGVSYCTFEGLRLDTTPDATVTRLAHLYWSKDAARSTTGNVFRDCTFSGRYVTGLTLGLPGMGNQCDHTHIDRCHFLGAWTPGDDALWQEGLHIGDGIHGNNLLHTVNALVATHHRKHVVVDASQLVLTGASLQWSEVDFDLRTSWLCRIAGVRSEGAERLMVTGGPASYGAQIALSDVQYHAERLTSDGQWIQARVGGVIRLDNLRCSNAPEGVAPTIYAAPPATLYLEARGILAGGNHPAPEAGALTVNEHVEATLAGYIELTPGGGVKAE